jgi:cytochrome c peroxidase
MVVIYRLVNIIPPEGASKDAQIIALFEDASCMTCHVKNGEMPFYSGMPVLSGMIRKDTKAGYRLFDMGETLDKMRKGDAVNEISLAKIEMATLIDNSMPPARFYLAHWGSSITPVKQKIIRDWLLRQREDLISGNISDEKSKFEPVRPLPSSLPTNERKSSLGKKLFYDASLSADNSVSCASCHNPELGGVDNKQYSEGVNKRIGAMNTPTVFNACLNMAQSWDGSSAGLAEHLGNHLVSPVIMANESLKDIVERLRRDSDLNDSFKKVFDDGITVATITEAITEFEKTLLTPNCRFDKYLKGFDSEINEEELLGYELFKSNKCATCHAGATFGGRSFEILGMYRDYFEERGWDVTKDDLGRFNITADENDRHRFKTPCLRNVALTKPYFHDGSRIALPDAVKAMSIYQTNRRITDEEAQAIAAFLETLTGDRPATD